MNDRPNIDVESNIWINSEDPTGLANNYHEASKELPGDLAIHLIVGSTDTREIEKAILSRQLTRKQREEFISFKFFLPFNHFDDQWINPEL
jgi:hypothetical protein